MKRTLIHIAAVAGVLVGLMTPQLGFAQTPNLPNQFFGTVTLSSGSAPDGLIVEAKVGGRTVGASVTADGKYGFMPNLLIATDSEGTNAGKTVEFFVAGIKADETVTFGNGASTHLPLTVSGSVGTISGSATDVIVEETVVVTPSQPLVVSLGNALTLNVTATADTSAIIEKIEQLPTAFFTGAGASPANSQILNGYEIKIVGNGLNVSVTMSYDDTEIDESSVRPYRFNGTGWVTFNDNEFTRNTTTNTITFSIPTAQTPYAVFGWAEQEESVPPPEDDSDGQGGASPPPASGGDGATPPPAAEDESPAPVTGDITGDGSVGILDFNALMIAWGRTGSGKAADLNGDGVVDILDFNMLMVNWTG